MTTPSQVDSDTAVDALLDPRHFTRYRIILRQAYPQTVVTHSTVTLSLFLVNEVGLYRHDDHHVNLMCRVFRGDATLEQYPLNGVSGFYHSGKGGVQLCLKGTGQVYVWIGGQEINDKMDIVPLVIGPIALVPSVPDSEPPVLDNNMYRSVSVRDRHVMVQEFWDAGIPGKVWDSALDIANYIARQCENDDAWLNEGDHVIDLSAGTGLLGLVVAAGAPHAHVTLTEVPEALNTLRHNAALNPDLSVSIQALEWANPQHMNALQRSNLVLASDLFYENDYIPALMATLHHLGPPIWIGYKQRGLTAAEQDAMWQQLYSNYTVTSTPLPHTTLYRLT
ncbi:hypothetical protein BZG36_04126 [Bifiguratus adelaidae]|uniref:Methyltransferase small domain-containing protein n=1 Tax=Bifiguratus adelaidae TaxID=1938954 RepID=A0A261XX56_9FUNG|nr:hypothetical protein BZG36_04126 [Bifiguratus adelaidae]